MSCLNVAGLTNQISTEASINNNHFLLGNATPCSMPLNYSQETVARNKLCIPLREPLVMDERMVSRMEKCANKTN